MVRHAGWPVHCNPCGPPAAPTYPLPPTHTHPPLFLPPLTLQSCVNSVSSLSALVPVGPAKRRRDAVSSCPWPPQKRRSSASVSGRDKL
jgi:hypothetical protein